MNDETNLSKERIFAKTWFFDRSSNGKIIVSGKDAALFLHNLCTNDIRGLKPGTLCRAYFCDRLAKVQGQARIFHTQLQGKPIYWLDCPPGTNESLARHIDKHWISEQIEFEDATSKYCEFHIAGPEAEITRTKMLPRSEESTSNAEWDEILFVQPMDNLLGTPGFNIVAELSRRESLLSKLQSILPAGSAEDFEKLRIEAVTPFFGKDIDEKRFVMEVADALESVSYQKGCYLGQEPIVMSRDRAGHVNRAMKLVKAKSQFPIAPNAVLTREEKSVGVTTGSTVFSSLYGAPIALAYIARGHQEAGTVFDLPDGAGEVEVV
jgi:folate-binding protein YgfZ